jgi:tyrosine-protein kinase Etk/Wzc
MKGEGPVEPKKRMIYAIGLLLGLAFPAGMMLLHDFFNTKVMSQEDIESVTHYPIIGHVFHSEIELKKRTLVLDRPNAPASEAYGACGQNSA